MNLGGTAKRLYRLGRNSLSGFRLPFAASRPVSLNLMATNRCNSRCKMCAVWKQKKEPEFTPGELAKILGDPLFNRLRYVGISGGEPTLREDLPELTGVVAGKKGIRDIGIITNAIQSDVVIDQIETCFALCRKNGIRFNVMVSLDGIGKMHDAIRGVAGNFDSALKVIDHLQTLDHIHPMVGCTIVKDNVWQTDEILRFCMDRDIPARFRVAEYIDRLYNRDCTHVIRNFNREEAYQIALFFSKLELTYEKNPSIQATYRNIREMVYRMRPRQSGCPYRSKAVGLDSRGNLIFCSPKSPVLGSCIETSALRIYKHHQQTRRAIMQNHCSSCLHDYHDAPHREFLKQNEETRHYKSAFSVSKSLEGAGEVDGAEYRADDWTQFKKPLIVGWYGTETVGDKAILGAIAERLTGSNPDAELSVASIYPFITRRTLVELDLATIRIVPTYSAEFLRACREADAVIMGGGPLMGMEPLGFVLKAFTIARENNVPAMIEGCGIGPISDAKYTRAVTEILKLSSHIKLRDLDSLNWAVEKSGRHDAECTGDPAIAYVEKFKQNHFLSNPPRDERYFGCYLREITQEYNLGTPSLEFEAFRHAFEAHLSKMIKAIMAHTGLAPRFLPMHTFAIGKDDRDFALRFCKTHMGGQPHEIHTGLSSPEFILKTMRASKINLCMRFHSVLFADQIASPFVAVDYTGGGKIKGYLADKNKLANMIERDKIARGLWEPQLKRLLKNIS